MHPIMSEMHARMIMEDRLRAAKGSRRAALPPVPPLRVRLGGLLIRAGRGLQGRVAHEPRVGAVAR